MAKNELDKLSDFDKVTALNSIKMEAPDIYGQIMQLQSSERGSQEGVSMPSEIKPPRSLAP
jgi:hypothetical protein